jgi:hypothetical protein
MGHSDIHLPATFLRAREVDIRPNQRRPPECREYPTFFCRLAGDVLLHGCAQTRRFRIAVGKTAGKRSNQILISLPPENLKARQAALAEAGSVFLDGALLRTAHNGSWLYIL